MSDDWDSVTKIGSKTRGAGGGGAKETVIRGNSALNAAKRSGAAISTEKKYASANAGSSAEGQFLTKVDRSDDIQKPKTVGPDVAKAVADARNSFPNAKNDGGSMTQKELANKSGVPHAIVAEYERGVAKPDPKYTTKLEKTLGIFLTGSKIGQSKFKRKAEQTK